MKPFAFVFPGQGSQSVGMLDAWGDHPVARQCVQEASDALGQDLGTLISQGSKEELALTTNTQPVMLLAGVVACRMWMHETSCAPALVAGHSLGEYSALVAADVLTLAQAVLLVRYRAQAMQDAVPVGVGAMAAVLGMPAEQVIAGCAQALLTFGPDTTEVVEAVNFNDPTQTVIAGTRAGVEKACELLKANGAKRALILPVSAPFHSCLMRPAADKLREKLLSVPLLTPKIPVINNIDVVQQTDPDAIRDALVRQAFGAVRWVECVQAMHAQGLRYVVECGPGKVLAGMVKRIEPELTGVALYDPATLTQAREILQ